MKSKIKSGIGIVAVIILFLFFSWLAQSNIELIQSLMINDALGILVYFLTQVGAIVIAPVTTIFLVPVAANLWGWVFTALLSIFAWTVGATIAFLLARKWGVPLIRHFVSLKSIYKIERKIPEEHIFITIVFLRMVIPLDILSYALGLFSKVKLSTYILASVIGMAPFAFVFSYMGVLPFEYQLIGWGLAGIAILIGIYFIFVRKGRSDQR